MARKPLVAGNWKCNLDHLEGIALVQRLHYHLEPRDYDASEVAVCPPFTALRSIQTLISSDRMAIALGAQDCLAEDAGAFTGEVSPRMLAKLDCAYVIVGHSERRQLYGETDAVVNAKLHAVLRHAMTPILCVGEALEEREGGEAEGVVRSQLRGSLEGVSAHQVGGLVIAYEPIWAIGTGRTALPADAQQMCAFVRGVVRDLHGDTAADQVRVQYGGSVKPGNAAELLRQPDIDGALVGGASLDADDLAVICRWYRT